MVHFIWRAETQRIVGVHGGSPCCYALDEDSPTHSTFEETVHDAEHAFEEVVDNTKGVLNDVMADIRLIYCYIFTFLLVDLR